MYFQKFFVMYIVSVLCLAQAVIATRKSAHSLVSISHTKSTCSENWCWLRNISSPVSKEIIKNKCAGYTKECSREGKGGWTCDCSGAPIKTSTPKPTPIHKCNTPYLSAKGGGTAYNSISVLMDDASGHFDFYWGTYKLPDRVTIFQGGHKIFSSDVLVSGTGMARVPLNGRSKRVRVVVNRPKLGSLFDFYPSCSHDHHEYVHTHSH